MARNFIEDYQAVSAEELSGLAATYLVPKRSAALIIAPAAKSE